MRKVLIDGAANYQPIPKWFKKFIRTQRVVIPKGRFVGKNWFYQWWKAYLKEQTQPKKRGGGMKKKIIKWILILILFGFIEEVCRKLTWWFSPTAGLAGLWIWEKLK